jgi:hypothetical protein
LIGTPRTAVRVAAGGLDAVARALEARGRSFCGPVDHGGNGAISRSLYSRDTGGNFIEFCEA